ncbi:MAG TPA: hypothetical protein DCG49_04110 [Ruminococcus sp.]|nr:hypothetical protein [Ruminococcus sp.]
MTVQDLLRYISVGKQPVVIFCEKKYEGICCLLKVLNDHTLLLDYDSDYDGTDGAFRATLRYASFDKMCRAVEAFTKKSLAELEINPYCYELFACEEPQISAFQWDLYNGRIAFPEDYESLMIGDCFWDSLYRRKISPDISGDAMRKWTKLYYLIHQDLECLIGSDDFELESEEIMDEIAAEGAGFAVVEDLLLLMERHPLDDFGMPGAVVRFVEQFYPDYIPLLIASVRRTPAIHTLWMLNRCINGGQYKEECISALKSAAAHVAADPAVRDAAKAYLDHQNA